jgi:hypothetical protein
VSIIYTYTIKELKISTTICTKRYMTMYLVDEYDIGTSE